MKIVLTFQRKTAGQVETLMLKPEEYYDPIGPDETYEKDAVPRLWNLYEYVDIEPRDLGFIAVDVYVGDFIKIRSERTDYYSCGRAEVTAVSVMRKDGALASEEIIVTTELDPDVFHILRLHRDEPSRRWMMNMNGICTSHEEGPDTWRDIKEEESPSDRDSM